MAKQEQNLIKLDEFNIQQLPELQNKKQEVSAKISTFKYVEIKDNSSYEEAKKVRTGVRTIRTDLQKEQKAVDKKIKDFILGPVKEAYEEIINAVIDAENIQQEEVTRWEDIKEKERLEKALLEIKRVEGIKAKINAYKTKWEDLISQLFFSEIDNLKTKLFEENEAFDRNYLEEFEILFDDVLISLGSSLYSKIDLLTKEEELRLERERLAEIQAEQNRVNAIKTKIDSWEKNWLYVINNLEFRNISVTQNEFETQTALDCEELQSEYAEKRNQIQELLSAKVSQLKEAEEQRIERENFLKEKAAFEEKMRLEEQKKKETEELLAKKEEPIKVDEYSTSEENYVEQGRLIEDGNGGLIDTATGLPYKEGEVKIFNSSTVETITGKLVTRRIAEIKDDCFVLEETWADILQEYYSQSSDTSFNETEQFVDWLEENYNVPTKK